MTEDAGRADLRDRLGNIDQIRDILFGAQLKEYSSRLEAVESNMALLQQEARSRTEEVKQTLATEFQAAIETLDKRLKSAAIKDEEEKGELRQQIDLLHKHMAVTADEVKQALAAEFQMSTEVLDKKFKAFAQKDDRDKLDLRQQLDRLNNRLNSNLDALNSDIDRQTASLRSDLLASREKLQADLTDLQGRVFAELEKRLNHLADTKLNRADLADLLLEVVLKLRDAEIVPDVKEAAQAQGGGGYLLPEGPQ